MRRLGLLFVTIALVLTGFPLAAATGSDSPAPERLRLDVTGWQRTAAPLPGAGDGIGPGSYLLITMDAPGEEDDGTFICTANFVWQDSSTTYLGAAGHCFLPPSAEKAIGSNPYVTKVEVCVRSCLFGGFLGAELNGEFKNLGQVVYARQHKSGDSDEQIGYDFGLVTIPSGLADLVRHAMPVWGGPTSVDDNRTGAVCMYGNGLLTGETFPTKARTGVRVGTSGPGWEAGVPINSGDSGSAITMCDEGAGGLVGTDALGLVTHGLGVGLVPTVVGFGTTVTEAKAMVRSDMNKSIEPVLGGTTAPPPPEPTGPNTAPNASFTSACSGNSCTFDGSSSTDSDGRVSQYQWSFGDGSSASGAVVSHSYGGSKTQTHTVTLTVVDDRGATDSATDTVSCSGKGRNRTCTT